jgi:hypothetical protein
MLDVILIRHLLIVPTGHSDNSPAFQRRVVRKTITSPEGTVEVFKMK